MRFDGFHARALACALTAALLGPAAAAQAGPPGTWTKVTGIEVPAHNTDDVGLVRTADGVLHLDYVVQPGSGANESVMHRAIARDAKSVAGPDIVATLKTMNNRVALISEPGGGLRALFAGLTDASGSGFLSTATSDAAGKAWSAPAAASNTSPAGLHPVYSAAGISGAFAADGALVTIWGDSSPGGGAMHTGNAATPDTSLGADCCQLDPTLARDASTGALYAGWYFLGDPADATEVTPIGAAKVAAPNGGAMQTGDRVGLTGRLGGKPGVYLGYTVGTNQFSGRPALWKVGDPKATTIAGQQGGQHIGIAPAPEGRLWLFWTRKGKVLATRTNRGATAFGAIRSLKPPAGADVVYRLAGEGSTGPLDLLGLFQKSSDLGYSHQRILPGLTLTVKPAKVKVGKKGTFRVTDAGESVKGATVTAEIGSTVLTGTTNVSGRVQLKIPAGAKIKAYKASAAKAGYVGVTKVFRVKK
jgi:hypothetical protein